MIEEEIIYQCAKAGYEAEEAIYGEGLPWDNHPDPIMQETYICCTKAIIETYLKIKGE